MRPKVERIAKSIKEIVSAWPNVESVILGENAATDILDPYFALVLDVYYRGVLMDSVWRKDAFGNPEAFETRDVQPKDRFLAEDLPVRVEYKDMEKIEKRVRDPEKLLWYVKDSGTYMPYRIVNGIVLFDRTGWIEQVKILLENLKDPFWKGVRETWESKMEHYLNDLGASVMRNDPYFYQISLSGFLKYCSGAIFSFNHQFESSHRFVTERMMKLSKLPEGFHGRWDTLLRSEAELNPQRKYEVALLLARSIVQFEV